MRRPAPQARQETQARRTDMTDSTRVKADGMTRAEQLAQCYRDDFAAYQYAFIEFFLAHLTDLGRSFRGDFHLPVLLALVGQARIGAGVAARAKGRDVSSISPEESGISASRIADVSGIPRETARRKLQKLKKSGWIDQLPSGSWYLIVDPDGKGNPARRDLAALDERSMMRVATFAARIEKLGRQK